MISPSALLLGLLALPHPAAAAALEAAVDPRQELAGVVQLLAPRRTDPTGFSRPFSAYADKARSLFGAYSSHTAVAQAADPGMSDFLFSDRAQVLVRLGPPPELKLNGELPTAFFARAGGQKNLERWLDGLRAFARDSKFMERFPQLKAELDVPVAAFKAEAAKHDVVGKMEAYAGLPMGGRYSVWLSPFHSDGPVVSHPAQYADGTVSVDTVIGPQSAETLEFWTLRVPGALWHETAHVLLDPLTDLFAPEIARSSHALSGMGWECYSEWPQCVREHVVRVAMLRVMEADLGAPFAAEQLGYENPAKFHYLTAMADQLKRYEKNRKSYPSLVDFYPRLLKPLPAKGPRQEGLPQAELLNAAHRASLLRVAERAEASKEKEVAAAGRRAKKALTAPPPVATASGPGMLPAAAAASLERAVAAWTSGNLQGALNEYEAAAKAAPLDAQSRLGRGVVLDALGRSKDALKAYDEAIAIVASNRPSASEVLAAALSSRATTNEKLGRLADARADLENALRSAPEDWPLRKETTDRIGKLGAK